MPLKTPKPTLTDSAHTLTKAGLSMIPVVGGPAVEFFQHLVQPPLERRRNEWMNAIGEKLQCIEKNGLKLEDLQSNEQFITAVMQASTAAIRTHKVEKLTALRNAILNIANGQGPEETTQHIFLSFIDEFSEMHLRILFFADAPKLRAGISVGGLGHLLEENIADLRGQRKLYDQLWKDLYLRGLVNTESLHVMMSNTGLGQSRTTELGKSLIKFISEPQ